uniref:Uncharacterized protein n=1 Tax=Mesocestoides corti TaxID=53468 RepID=A0A5K3EJX5_MESCO
MRFFDFLIVHRLLQQNNLFWVNRTNIPCNGSVCSAYFKPGTLISAKVDLPFQLVANRPVFSSLLCNRTREICTEFEQEIITLAGTFGAFVVNKIVFDCYPPGFSTLEVVRVGQEVPQASEKNKALSPHYITVRPDGRIDGSPQIAVACHHSGILEPYLSTGVIKRSLLTPISVDGKCPEKAVCHRKIQRVSFHGLMEQRVRAYSLKGAFPEEEIKVLLIPSDSGINHNP